MWKKFKRFLERLPWGTNGQYIERTQVIDQEEYRVREITAKDIKELLQVERLVYAGELPWTKSAFLTEIYSRFQHLYLCILKEERMVGFIGVRVLARDGHITNIAVVPEFQGKGIGAFLMQEIERYVRRHRCETMSLEVRLSNRDAQRLYRKMGFVSRTIKTAYYSETNEDALDMVKYLDE